MKKFALILVAAGAIAFASCNSKTEEAAANVDSMANAATEAVQTTVDTMAAAVDTMAAHATEAAK